MHFLLLQVSLWFLELQNTSGKMQCQVVKREACLFVGQIEFSHYISGKSHWDTWDKGQRGREKGCSGVYGYSRGSYGNVVAQSSVPGVSNVLGSILCRWPMGFFCRVRSRRTLSITLYPLLCGVVEEKLLADASW